MTILKTITASLGAVALSALVAGNPALAQSGSCDLQFMPEDGASLTLLRWKRFVQAEEDAFMEIVANYEEDCGVAISVQNESLDDVQPKASVAANVDQGPDMVWGLYSLAQLFPDKLVDVTDLAEMLGNEYGGWVDSAVKYGQGPDGNWIDIPIAYNGNYINYRISAVEEAGYDEFPTTTDEFLKLAQKLKEIGKPMGFALGRATGDGNAWIHWALWSHGAKLVDENDEVAIDSPETRAALEYVKQLADTMVPGVASWNDSNNNKAFLSEEVWLTNNGPSIYPAAQSEAPEIAEDMNHAFYPIGPAGVPTEFALAYNMSIFKYTPYPNAAKGFIEYLFKPENYNPWLEGAVAYLTPPLKDFESNAAFTKDPKLAIFKDAAERTLTAGYPGSVGQKAAAALADFVVLDMFANVATGNMTVDEAVTQAQRQAERIYR